jgi:hypothetical protein
MDAMVGVDVGVEGAEVDVESLRYQFSLSGFAAEARLNAARLRMEISWYWCGVCHRRISITPSTGC